MGWMDDDLHLRIVGEPTNYFYGTQTEVMAVPVMRNGVVDAYAFYGIDADENAAGFAYRMSERMPVAEWYASLSESFAHGLTASEAIHALLGTALVGGWIVGTDLAPAPSKDALRAELKRVAPAYGRAHAAAAGPPIR